MTAKADAALLVDKVDISYGNTTVVSGLSLTVEQGETYGLIGLNGAGKTTLIKSVIGLRRTKFGNIMVNNSPAGHKEAKKTLAYLPERFDPPAFLYGHEFIRFSLQFYGRIYDADQARKMAESLALDPDVLAKKVQTYSKGMKQKLGLLATLATEAPVLILDEPMSGLDPQARAAVKDALVQARKDGRTLFLSSHILADMDEICNRVGVLHKGNLVFTGAPSALKKQEGNENLERAFLSAISSGLKAA